jgi:hypothetical protein
MKLILLITYAFCQIALANTYPSLPSASNMLVQSEAIRIRVAPFYGESSTGTVSVENVRITPIEYSINIVPERLIANVPQFSKYKLNDQQQIEQTSAFDRMQQVVPTKNIAEVATVETPDPFSIRLEFDWNEPHGQFMQQLLIDIKAAKQEGDTETYKKLTAQCQTWADLYLIKGTPPMVME